MGIRPIEPAEQIGEVFAHRNKMLEGFEIVEGVLFLEMTDSVCPAICMTEGCDYTAGMEPDQKEGYCEACGGNTVVSVLVLAGLI